MQYVLKPSFTSGEVDSTLVGRVDYEKYGSACRVLENFIIQPHGGLYRRPGSRLIDSLPGKSILMDFQFNVEQAYVLIFSDQMLWIVKDKGIVTDGGSTVEVVTPYLEDDLKDLYFSQSADTIYICHKDHQVRKLTRNSHVDWTLTELDFGAAVPVPVPTAIAFTGTVTNAYSQEYRLVGVTEDGTESEIVTGANLTVSIEEANNWVAGNKVEITITMPAELKWINVFKEKAGGYGLIGVTEQPSSGTTVVFRDDNFIPNTGLGLPEKYNPFETDYPTTTTFFQQRLYFGGTESNPQTIWGSRIGLYENFDRSEFSRDDDSVEFALDSDKMNAINWMIAKNKILIGTQGSEWTLSGPANLPITPSQVNAVKQSAWGSKSIKPLVVGNDVLHVQRGGRTVTELVYSLESDGYRGLDRTILAKQIFSGRNIESWAHQRLPDSVIWCVLSDGTVAAMTYLKEHDIWGWHRHETPDGTFESVAVIPGEEYDEVYFVVNRGGVRYIEYLEDKWTDGNIENAVFLDSSLTYDDPANPVSNLSGLDHLEGQEVYALVDGVPLGPFTVESGVVELGRSGGVIHVGLNYTSKMAPLGVEADDQKGTSLGRQRSIPSVILYVDDTVGGKFGQIETALDPFKYTPEKYGNAVQPYSGNIKVSLPTRSMADGSFYIVQDQPLPMTILAMVPKLVATGD